MPDTQTKSTTKPLSADDLSAVIAIDKATSCTLRRGYFEKRLKAARLDQVRRLTRSG